jgi:uncharacterized coiled-coil protein SlyX
MDERLRRTFLIIFTVLIIIGFGFAINFSMKADVNRKLFEKEMAFRLDMEEKVSKLREDNLELATALKNKDLEYQEKDELIAELNKTVSDQQNAIEGLRLELKGMTLLKDQIEDNLKTELSKE